MLPNLFRRDIDKDAIAKMLKISPEKLNEFETAYQNAALSDEIESWNTIWALK